MTAVAQVYRAYDANGRLLYVGCSTSVDARLRAHEQSSIWWPFMERITREDFPNRASAAEAEVQIIATEHPRWNIQGRSLDHPDGFVTVACQATWLAYERDVSRRWRRLRAEEAALVAKVRRVRLARAAVDAEIVAINSGVAIDEVVA